MNLLLNASPRTASVRKMAAFALACASVGFSGAASAALPAWTDTISFASNPGARFDAGVDCEGDVSFGNCHDLRYTTAAGNTFVVSGRVYSSASDTTPEKAYVENYQDLLTGTKGLGVDSGLFDGDDTVDDYESLVLTFANPTGLFGWTVYDPGIGTNGYRVRVDGGGWTNYNNSSVTWMAPILEGSVFEFQSLNDSFVLTSITVPEPGAVGLVFSGLAVLSLLSFKRRRS